MKRFLLRTLAVALPVLVWIVGVNGVAGYLKNTGDNEKRMAGLIAEGYNVTGLTKYNDRLFLKFMIERMDSLPEEIVLGSSRAMQITHEFASYDRFYNSALFGAYLDDMAAVYDLYEVRGAPIRRIVIGIDPWIFIGPAEREYETLAGEYREISAKIGTGVPSERPLWAGVDRLASLGSLGSLGSIRESFRSVWLSIRPERGAFAPTKDSLNIGATEYPDGSYSVTEAERNVSRRDLSRVDVGLHLNKDFTRLSENECGFFVKFILYLKNKGIEVVLVFAPYHPVVWAQVREHDPMVIETERFVRDFASENGIEVLGTFDPGAYKLDVTKFINGGHPKKEVFYSVFGKW